MNFNPNYLSNFNLNTTHPIQANSNEYQVVPKYVSIHSEDRNYIQFPSSTSFEVTLPQSLDNVSSVRVADWSFPSNYNTFSLNFQNIELAFTINNPFKPTDKTPVDYKINLDIYDALAVIEGEEQTIIISEGFYTPTQMITELENKLNFYITNYINNYYSPSTSTYSYTRFKVVYNQVQQNIWFGNTADQFILNNSSIAISTRLHANLICELPKNRGKIGRLSEFANYGLPAFIGLPKTNITSINEIDGITNPRFFYGDAVIGSGDEGNWLIPDFDAGASEVYWIRSPNKINLMGPSYLYCDLGMLNSIDELYPYQLSEFNMVNPSNSGRVNSVACKIPIQSTPLSQYFSYNYNNSVKTFNPPLSNLKKVSISLRYHDNTLPDFGLFNWSITLEIYQLVPVIIRRGILTSPPNNLENINFVSFSGDMQNKKKDTSKR
jgi:hypothetical protein